MNIAPGEAAFLSAINPFQPTRIQVHHRGNASNDDPTSYEFVLLCSKDNTFEEKTHDFGSLRITVGRSLAKSTGPTIWIRAENAVRVFNLSSSDLFIRMNESGGNPRSIIRANAGQERSMCYPTSGKDAIFAVGFSPKILTDENLASNEDIDWSPEIPLSLMGDTKSFTIMKRATCDPSIVPAYSILLENTDGTIRLFIRPLVVVLNAMVSHSTSLIFTSDMSDSYFCCRCRIHA